MIHTYVNFLPNLKEASANLIVVPFMFKLPLNFFRFMSIVEAIPRNKPLVIFVIIAIIGVSTVPGLLPHAFHGMHIVDLVMHQAGIALASVLAFLAVNSYIMTKSKKMLIVSAAFMLFAFAELIQLLESEKHHVIEFWKEPNEIAHIMLFGMLVLFAVAIFKRK